MNIKELVEKSRTHISNFQELIAKIRKDYAKSDNFVSFAKNLITKEILEKKERIPGAIITLWLLLLTIFTFNLAIVFNFGILPIMIYYVVQIVRNAPAN